MKTITNIFISHLILLVLFGGAALAFAQTDETTSDAPPIETRERAVVNNRPDNEAVRQEIRENNQENIETRQINQQEIQAVRQQNQAERRANLNEQARQRIINLAALMSNRVESAIDRMMNISTRLESRIDKLEAEGKDVSDAQQILASANLSLAEAKTTIGTIDRQVTEAVGSEDVRTAWLDVRDIFIEVKDQLKTAQLELRNTVSALKSTSTVETTPDITEEDEVDAN